MHGKVWQELSFVLTFISNCPPVLAVTLYVLVLGYCNKSERSLCSGNLLVGLSLVDKFLSLMAFFLLCFIIGCFVAKNYQAQSLQRFKIGCPLSTPFTRYGFCILSMCSANSLYCEDSATDVTIYIHKTINTLEVLKDVCQKVYKQGRDDIKVNVNIQSLIPTSFHTRCRNGMPESMQTR